MRQLTKKFVDKVTYDVIAAAIEVQEHMGVGLYEEVYQYCMEAELQDRGMAFERQQSLVIPFKDHLIPTSLRYDLLVEDTLVVDLKSVLKLLPVFDAQMLTYMRLLEKPKGLIINFMSKNIFYEGQKTLVNDLYHNLPD